ncbi:hypothetical protein ACSS6W_000059 [Trichoderma asperelloides]|uniref:Uncharacterized protein n=1 Tax=Trichoderma asperellum TaxID=101201 RepID=A0A6V8R824_TRIAP|nr:hypothetical protein TASIC1_0017002800 [Trichoderma asperellum]
MPDTDPSNPGRYTSAEAGEGSSLAASVPPVLEEDPTGVPRYLKLDPELLPSDSSWSNDPKRMNLETYFSLNPAVPSLAESFNLDNLIPIMVKVDYDRGDTYLLTVYRTDNFYLWNEIDTAMWAFRKPKNRSLKLEDVVELVSTETYGGQDLIRQYRSRQGSWGQG